MLINESVFALVAEPSWIVDRCASKAYTTVNHAFDFGCFAREVCQGIDDRWFFFVWSCVFLLAGCNWFLKLVQYISVRYSNAHNGRSWWKRTYLKWGFWYGWDSFEEFMIMVYQLALWYVSAGAVIIILANGGFSFLVDWLLSIGIA